MYRTHTCGELRLTDQGKIVTLAGWVQRSRKFGGITFIDIRDRYGITQGVLNEELNSKIDNNIPGREYVVQLKGLVVERSSKNINIPTGSIEIEIKELNILSLSKIPPFTIEDNSDGGEDIRMKFRYLDLRRSVLRKNLELRYAISRSTRNYLHENGFLDIETPFLIKSTPEGARDFVVPSRMEPGLFYALPQSPQTFKQLLMVSGFDRYYQIVKCFRDEDLRADRQPEFTQIDCEMTFVEQEDILVMFEGLIKRIFLEVKQIALPNAFQRMTWEEAMWNYGNDKPDIRFGLTICNLRVLSDIFPAFSKSTATSPLYLKNTGFPIFDEAQSILAICIPTESEITRKEIELLSEWVKRPQVGMKGISYIRYYSDGSIKSSFDKFYSESFLKEIVLYCKSEPGDLILLLAGPEDITRKAISELRLFMGEKLRKRNPEEYKLIWIIDFPLFEYNSELGGWTARHHPFTSPKLDQIELMMKQDPKILNQEAYFEHPFYNIRANAYDLVLNGNEIGGGSIRIFQRELQEKMFAAIGLTEEDAQYKFGFLMGAFEYGAPPHGGIAFGLDRLCAILGGSESIRDFIAFPKNNSGRDTMLDAPSKISLRQLKELNL
ncbi:MAG TPA: aspartate--tRNA ligase [Chitinophagaceae bacterium]|nr:aspartate--tRNA ligase [Chitinophagaceae bacterium]